MKIKWGVDDRITRAMVKRWAQVGIGYQPTPKIGVNGEEKEPCKGSSGVCWVPHGIKIASWECIPLWSYCTQSVSLDVLGVCPRTEAPPSLRLSLLFKIERSAAEGGRRQNIGCQRETTKRRNGPPFPDGSPPEPSTFGVAG